MMHDFELHEFFYSPKNVLLKALLYYLCTIVKVIKEGQYVLFTYCIIHVDKGGYISKGRIFNFILSKYI
jgi:hypothetical protein